MEELISVIVPAYNVEKYLPRCLECLSMQTYRNLEIILVDDGSTDSTGRICDDYAASDPRARVIHHESNIGLWAARNTGQDAATGEYLWFPDGDDYFHKDIVRIMYEAINQNNGKNTFLNEGNKTQTKPFDIAIVSHRRTESMDEDTSSYVNVDMTYYSSQDEMMYDLFKSNNLFTSVWNKLLRRKFVEDIRNENYARSQDWDYCFIVFLRIGNGVLINNQLYYWVDRPGSNVNSGDYLRVNANCRLLMYYRNYLNLPPEKKKYGHYLLDGLYRMIINYEEKLYGDKVIRRVVESNRRQVIRNTWQDYLHCGEISVGKRLSRFCRAEMPMVSHWLSDL